MPLGLGLKQFVLAAALPPTISAVTPNAGSAAGGDTITIEGANFTGASVTIDGQSCTDVVVAGGGASLTCVTPAYSTPNGSTAGQTIAITTPAGSVSSSGNTQNFFYLPSNTQYTLFLRADVGITLATGVSAWADQSGSGNNAAQATGSKQPSVTANFNGSGLPAITGNGSQELIVSAPTGIGNGKGTAFVVCSVATDAQTAPAPFIVVTSSGPELYLLAYSTALSGWACGDALENITNTGTADTDAHVLYGGSTAGVNAGFAGLDETTTTGTLRPTGVTSYVSIFGVTPSFPMTGSVAWVVYYPGNISSGDSTTVQTIMKTIYGTP
jgi:hypothetical protein